VRFFSVILLEIVSFCTQFYYKSRDFNGFIIMRSPDHPRLSLQKDQGVKSKGLAPFFQQDFIFWNFYKHKTQANARVLIFKRGESENVSLICGAYLLQYVFINLSIILKPHSYSQFSPSDFKYFYISNVNQRFK
jgi:hypothetical protein